MAKSLTTVSIKNLRPSPVRREVKDGGSVGLYAVIEPSGRKSFAMRFRRADGRSARLVLGAFDPTGESSSEPVLGAPLSLQAARRLAADIARQRALGIDVISARKTEKRQRKEQHQEGLKTSFAVVARQFIAEYGRKTRGWKNMAGVLGLSPTGEIIKNGLADRWSTRPIKSLSPDDIHAVVVESRAKAIPGRSPRYAGTASDARARSVFTTLSSLFRWARQQRLIEVSPMAALFRPEPSKQRDRILEPAELRAVWQAAGEINLNFATVIKLLMLTACRLQEIGAMRYSELSEDGTTLVIPAARSKNGKAHTVFLPPMAQELIKAVPRVHDGDLVFTTNGKTAISGWSKIKNSVDQISGVTDWRIHDLRRSAATMMAEAGIAPHIVEHVLGHAVGSAISRVYNRFEYAREKRDALEKLATVIANLVAAKSTNVVPLRA